jgi:hypothetical protein
VQPQWVGCCQGGARSSKQSRRVAAAVVVQCAILCWQIKSPEAPNAVMLLDEHKIRGSRVSSPVPTLPTSQQFASSRDQGPKGQGSLSEWPRPNIAGSVENRQVVQLLLVVYIVHSSRRVRASGRGAALTGGVLNAAKLAQDWARGQGVSDGLAGPCV